MDLTEEQVRDLNAELDAFNHEERDAAEQRKMAEAEDGALFDEGLHVFERWYHARIAFPGMTYDEFIDVARKRAGKGKRGPKKHDSAMRAEEPLTTITSSREPAPTTSTAIR